MNIWLVGMMGSGKTTVGTRAAGRLGVPFHDTDEMVESRSGLKVATIWEKSGEGRFRKLETEAIQDLQNVTGIIAVGGGAPLVEPNRTLLIENETVVWLKCEEDVLVQRLIADSEGRPLLSGRKMSTIVQELTDERRPVYEGMANHHIDTSRQSIEEVTNELVELWNVLS